MRLRTIDKGHAELLREDPGCGLSKTALRRLAVSGAIPSILVGNVRYIDLDRLPEDLFGHAGEPEPEAVGGVRRISLLLGDEERG